MPSLTGTPPINPLHDPAEIAKRKAANAQAASIRGSEKLKQATIALQKHDAKMARRKAAKQAAEQALKQTAMTGVLPHPIAVGVPFTSADHAKFTKG